MAYTLTRAAAAAGRCKSTILRAIQSGKISAIRDDATGSWLIEPAELHRVYRVAVESAANPPVQTAPVPLQQHNGVQHRAAPMPLQARLETAEVRIAGILEAQRLRDDVIADLRQRLDRADEQRQQVHTQLAEVQAKLVAVLTDPPPPPPAAPQSPAALLRRWWHWRRS